MKKSVMTSVIFALTFLLAACSSDPVRDDPFPQNWQKEISGDWDGERTDGDKSEIVTTRLLTQNSGRVSGVYFYTARGNGDTGSLTDCRADGFGTLSCLWTDKDGSGPIRLQFNDDFDLFRGTWGRDQIDPEKVWTGKKP